MNSIEMSGKSEAKVGAAVGRELLVADLPTGLSEEQVIVLRLIYNGRSLSEAATGANVNRSTLYRCPNRFLIYIENKIRAPEGVDQTSREWKDACRLAGDLKIPLRHIHAFFLTPQIRTAAESKFTLLLWSQIANVFERFADMAKPPDVKVFCKHYTRALRMSVVAQDQLKEADNDKQ